MNIFTVPYGSKSFYSRPDTSLNRDSNDYFCPDEVDELAVAVFIYVRAAKAGKSVSSKFAGRYYSVCGSGVQLYAPSIEADGSPENWWLSRSLDNSTFLCGDEHPADSLPIETKELIDKAIETISRFCSFRTGDYIAIETAPATLLGKEKGLVNINGKEINIIR